MKIEQAVGEVVGKLLAAQKKEQLARHDEQKQQIVKLTERVAALEVALRLSRNADNG